MGRAGSDQCRRHVFRVNAKGPFFSGATVRSGWPAAGQLQVNVPMAAAIQFLHNGRNEGLFCRTTNPVVPRVMTNARITLHVQDIQWERKSPSPARQQEFNAACQLAALGASRSSGGKIAFITLNTFLIKMSFTFTDLREPFAQKYQCMIDGFSV